MPSFDDLALVDSPPEEVFKYLHDPVRLPSWWRGVGSVEDVHPVGAGTTEFTLYPEGWPDFPMRQQLRTSADGRRVTFSCHVSFLEFEWVLEEVENDRTRVRVHVEIPEQEAHRLGDQRSAVRASLERLQELTAMHPG